MLHLLTLNNLLINMTATCLINISIYIDSMNIGVDKYLDIFSYGNWPNTCS